MLLMFKEEKTKDLAQRFRERVYRLESPLVYKKVEVEFNTKNVKKVVKLA